ncbi:MAG: beta-ketoacyl-ACP synthase, partial [Mesorhizobium sp.]
PLPEIDWNLQIAKRGDQRQMETWQRVDGVGREAGGFEHRLQAGLDELAPMRIRAFSQRRDKADA